MRAKKEINIQIGEQVKLAREGARLTQEQLAERVDVSPQYVSDLERGVVGISIATLKKVCTALCVSSDQILFGHTAAERGTLIAGKCEVLTDAQFSILSEVVDKFIEAMKTADRQ